MGYSSLQLARKIHPDKHQNDPKATQAFQSMFACEYVKSFFAQHKHYQTALNAHTHTLKRAHTKYFLWLRHGLLHCRAVHCVRDFDESQFPNEL